VNIIAMNVHPVPSDDVLIDRVILNDDSFSDKLFAMLGTIPESQELKQLRGNQN